MSLLFRVPIAAVLALAMTSPAIAADPATVAIVGADILPMTSSDKLPDQTVVLRGEHIVAIGPRATIDVPHGAHVIDAKGLTMMPGLVDMHIHLAPVAGEDGDAAARALAVMLGHGVTTARGMAGSPANLVVRDKIEAGTLPGPRLYAAAPGLHAQNTSNAAEGRKAVAAARDAGYDLVKSHHLVDPEVWTAVRDEAKRQGLTTAGHVPNEIGLDRAVGAGQQIEHLDGILHALLPEGSEARNTPFAQIPPPAVIRAAADITDAEIDAIARRLAEAGSVHVPTLSLFELITAVERPTEELRQSAAMRYIPQPALVQWTEQRRQFASSGFTAADGRAFTDLRRRIVRALHTAGVPLMAGSDTPQSFHIWGPGLIAEIESLHRAGLSRYEALRSATVVPRDYFRSLPANGSTKGWPANFGTVETSARADLILLAGDPATDLSVLYRPQYVIKGGVVRDRQALDRMLDAAADAAKAAAPPPSNSTN